MICCHRDVAITFCKDCPGRNAFKSIASLTVCINILADLRRLLQGPNITQDGIFFNVGLINKPSNVIESQY